MIGKLLFGSLFTAGAALGVIAGCSLGSTDVEVTGENEQHIQGGQLEPGFPAVGEVVSASGVCSGALISPSFVLTAAHCAAPTLAFNTGTNPSDFVAHAVDRQVVHPSNDLLVLHLAQPIFTIAPLAMNTGGIPSVNTTCTGVGFGAHDEADGSVTVERKRSATEQIEAADLTTIAVLMVSGVADHGDSGGPLICDGRIAGVVHNHTDGAWPAHIRENYATIDAEWIAMAQGHYDTRGFGGNILAEDFFYQTSDACAPEYVRAQVRTRWISNLGGFCAFDHWVSEDPHDCRAVIHAHTGGGWFGGTCLSSVSEVAQNLAAGKPASQSSDPWGGSAARAVDGNTDGNWYDSSVTHTDFDAQAWWQVDLGATTDIGEVVIYNRTDCCGDRLADFDILVSSDGVSWQMMSHVDGIAPARMAVPMRTSGRFVRVRLRGTNYLSLAEVEVFAPWNLAAGRPAMQSSDPWGASASRAVDGNIDGNWYASSVTHTDFDAQAWWQVDLGATTDIGEVVLYNRTDCCGDRLADFDVELSQDGNNWLTASSFGGPAPTRTALSIQASGRFVRVRLRGTNYLSLAEVRVFAPWNLAVGKTATQSSTGWGDAGRAVDGNVDGDWHNGSVTHTRLDAQPWWQVDLGAVTEIGKVVLYNRTECCGDRLADFDLLVSQDGVSWQTEGSLSGISPARMVFSTHASARFVKVRLHGTNYLSLAEVQVFAPPNLAAGKTATQSSNPFGGDAARAVDGNPDGDWSHGSVSHTDFDANAWWQVDLGAVMYIGELAVYNRTDCCADRLADFDIQISNDGINWQTSATFSGPALARSMFSIQALGRFVRVRLHGTNYLQLAEVRIFPLSWSARSFALTVNASGNGKVTGGGINCPRTCSRSYYLGTVVTLTATPGSGAHFVGWSGACSGSATTCDVAIAGNTTVGASFGDDTPPVCGNGTMETGEMCDDGNNDSGDRCSPDCQHSCPVPKVWCDCTASHCTTTAQCDLECSN